MISLKHGNMSSYNRKRKIKCGLLFKNWMTTRLRSWICRDTNRVHIAWTQTGRQSILIFTFLNTIYVKCKFLT